MDVRITWIVVGVLISGLPCGIAFSQDSDEEPVIAEIDETLRRLKGLTKGLQSAVVFAYLDGWVDPSRPSDKEALWVNEYRDLFCVIEGLPRDAKEIGLSKDRIRSKLERELRSAGIRFWETLTEAPMTAQDHLLYVNLNVVGDGWSLSVEFKRESYWQLPENQVGSDWVTVWNRGAAGTHSDRASFVLDAVEVALERFLNEYLKANQE